MQTHYQALGVSENANLDEINAAYRRLAKVYHPDMDSGNPEKFKRINEAQSVLKNNYKRPVYDLQLKLESSIVRRRASNTEENINVLASIAIIVSGIWCWVLGDKPGENYNGWFVLAGYLLIFYGVGLFVDREVKFSNPLTVAKRVSIYIIVFLIQFAIGTSLIGAVVIAIVSLLAFVSWLNSNFLHIFPNDF